MNQLPTLILSPRYTSDSIALSQAAAEMGWAVERLLRWSAPEHLQNQPVALYGEPFFVSAIAEQLSLSLLEPPFDWLSRLPYHYLQRHVTFATLAEARQVTQPSFIKPADDKSFTAQVYQNSDALPATEHLPTSTPILISEPVEWEVEYRGFVLNRQLQTLSPYFRNGSLVQTETGEWPAPTSEMEQATEYYAKLLSDEAIELPPAVVVDIGKIKERGWAVVEANPAWSSGIYGCEPRQVLNVVARAIVANQEIGSVDAAWVINRVISPT